MYECTGIRYLQHVSDPSVQASGRKARERSPNAYSQPGRKRSFERHSDSQPALDSWREDEGSWPHKRRAGGGEQVYKGRPDTRKTIPCTFYNTPRVGSC